MNVLPTGWCWSSLGQTSQVIAGQSPPSETYNDHGEGLPFFQGKAEFGSLHPTARKWCAEPTKIAEPGDILISVRAPVGPTNVASEECGIGRGLAAIRVGQAVIRDWTLYYLRLSEPVLAAKGVGTTFTAITGDMLRDHSIPLPPLAEQRRIVAKLDALDASAKHARADLDRIPTLVARAKQAILTRAIRGHLTWEWRSRGEVPRHSLEAFGDLRRQREKYEVSRRGVRLGGLPPLTPFAVGIESWFGCCLADVCELRLGYAFKSDWFSDDGPRLLRGANIGPGYVDWTDEKRLSPARVEEYRDYILRKGDIVIAMDRPIISTGVKVARIGADDDGAFLVQRVASPKCGPLLEPDYAWALFNSELFRAVILSTSTGSDLPHISGNDILSMEIPLPPISEQREIVRRIEAAFTKIDRIAAEAGSARALLDRLDQAILAKAFRGELVPQDPSDEPAEKLLEKIKAARAAPPARKTRKKQS